MCLREIHLKPWTLSIRESPRRQLGGTRLQKWFSPQKTNAILVLFVNQWALKIELRKYIPVTERLAAECSLCAKREHKRSEKTRALGLDRNLNDSP